MVVVGVLKHVAEINPNSLSSYENLMAAAHTERDTRTQRHTLPPAVLLLAILANITVCVGTAFTQIYWFEVVVCRAPRAHACAFDNHNTALAVDLGSTYRCPNNVDIEPLSLASHLKVVRQSPCYYHQDLHYRRLQPGLRLDLQRTPTRHPTRRGIETYVWLTLSLKPLLPRRSCIGREL